MNGGEALVVIILFAGFFACIFGIYYLNTRQNLAMIEKGINPKIKYNSPAPYKNLKWALLLIGAGAGLFAAYILDEYVLVRMGSWTGSDGIRHYYQENNPAIYFALIAIGGGLGLFGSYKMEKKWFDENKKQ